MLILGLGVKTKFCGLGLAIGWPWDCGLGQKIKATTKVSWDYKIHLLIRPHRAKIIDTARITGFPQMQCSTVN